MTTPAADQVPRTKQPTNRHYLLVIVVEVAVIAALAWLGAAFR